MTASNTRVLIKVCVPQVEKTFNKDAQKIEILLHRRKYSTHYIVRKLENLNLNLQPSPKLIASEKLIFRCENDLILSRESLSHVLECISIVCRNTKNIVVTSRCPITTLENIIKTRWELKLKGTVRATLLTESRLVFALHLIGWEGSLDCSRQSTHDMANWLPITFNTQLKV